MKPQELRGAEPNQLFMKQDLSCISSPKNGFHIDPVRPYINGINCSEVLNEPLCRPIVFQSEILRKERSYSVKYLLNLSAQGETLKIMSHNLATYILFVLLLN